MRLRSSLLRRRSTRVRLIVFCAAIRVLPAAGADIQRELTQAQSLQRNGSLKQARSAFEHTLADSLKAKTETVRASSLLGLAQIDLAEGRYAQCIAGGAEATDLYRTARMLKNEGLALTTVGQARYFAGDTPGALRDFEASLRIARDTNDREAEITRRDNMGGVYFALGRYGDAFDQFRAARERLGGMDREPWFASRRQLTNANLAVLYQGIGEYRRALSIYAAMGAGSNALPLAERAQVLANMGTLYRRLGDPATALEVYQEARSIYKARASAAGELAVLNNIGIDYVLDLNDYPKAVETFTGALQLGEKSGARRSMMTSLLYRGETLLRAGKPNDARSDFENARRFSDDLHADEEKWRADYGLARAAESTGDPARSDEFLRDGIAVIERMRKATSQASSRTGFLTERRDVYDLLLEHLAREAHPGVPAIFSLMERARARDLQDRLKASAPNVEDLRRRVPKDTVILEYWLGRDSLAAIAISSEGTQLVFTPLNDAEHTALQGLPRALADSKRDDWRTVAGVCSRLLLSRVDALRRRDLRNIVIAPDGALARIPFEALPDPASPAPGGLMIDRFTISYLPFASAFSASESHSRPWNWPWRTMFLAFANPVAGAADPGTELTTEPPSDIPDAAEEIRNAAEALGGRHDLYLGREARKSFLSNRPPGTPVLHFATHAFADLENPDRSYVLFAGAMQGFDYLFLREAAALRAAEGSLVTVSACDSGNGRFERGEGIQSFGAAFLAAGARAAVTSLWRAGDKPSAELMTRFYTFLASGESAAEALRDAKLTFRNSAGSAAHPAYWATFVLTGDGEMRTPLVISWVVISLCVFGTVSLLCVPITIRGAKIRKTAGMA